MSLPTRMYEMDDDLEPVSSLPIGALVEPVFFDPDRTYRIYWTHAGSDEGQYIDLYVTNGVRNVYHDFAMDATSDQVEAFERKVKQRSFVDMATKRWGSVRIVFDSPGVRSLPTQTSLHLYWDGDDVGWAYLRTPVADGLTWEELFDDFAFLRGVFEDAAGATSRSANEMTSISAKEQNAGEEELHPSSIWYWHFCRFNTVL